VGGTAVVTLDFKLNDVRTFLNWTLCRDVKCTTF